MDEYLIKDINEQLSKLFVKIKSILFNQDSYKCKVELKNINSYLDFVSNSITKDYNRIKHIYYFVTEKETIGNQKINPFCFLRIEAEMKISSIYSQANWLLKGFNEAISEDNQIMELEPHEMNK